MNQNVNFLKSFPKVSKRLPAQWIFWSAGILAALLSAISIVVGVQQFMLDQKLEAAKQERLQAELAFQQVAKAYPLFASDKPLVEQVSEYEKTLREKQSRYEAMTHKTMRNPFSKYMQTLSTIAPVELWFTNINIDQDNRSISLSGFSLQPIQVSILLESLRTAPLFSELVFDLFYVKKVSDKNYIQFEVATDKLISEIDVEKEEDLGKKIEAEDNAIIEGTSP